MMTELIDIKGVVVDYTAAWKPDKSRRYFAISYVTVECPMGKDSDGNDKFCYYTFKVKSSIQIRKIYRQGEIECTIARRSIIWTKSGKWQMKDAKVFNEGERVAVGKVPIVIEDYELIGEIECALPDPKDLAENYPNMEEEDDLPF